MLPEVGIFVYAQSFRQHLDQFLFSLEQIISNKFQRLRTRSVVETRDDRTRRLVKRRSLRKLPRSLSLDLQHRRTLRDISKY